MKTFSEILKESKEVEDTREGKFCEDCSGRDICFHTHKNLFGTCKGDLAWGISSGNEDRVKLNRSLRKKSKDDFEYSMPIMD